MAEDTKSEQNSDVQVREPQSVRLSYEQAEIERLAARPGYQKMERKDQVIAVRDYQAARFRKLGFRNAK